VRARGRARRTIDARRPDLEIRQLWALVDAYGSPAAPEVLVIGDSAMMWTSPFDRDQRTLAQMVADELGDSCRVHALAGAGYNPRIVRVFLEALASCPHKPRAIVLPASLLMATQAWSTHPSFCYVHETPELRRIFREDDREARRLPRSGEKDWEVWDRTPAPSLFGARRTLGEFRLVVNAPRQKKAWWEQPNTRWQQAVRMRHMMDVYNAETLTADSPGVRLLADLATYLRELGIPTVAYVAPVNRDVLVSALGDGAAVHVERNAESVASAYLDAAGPGHQVVNAVFAAPSEEYGDPVHLNDAGRRRFAPMIAEGVRTGITVS